MVSFREADVLNCVVYIIARKRNLCRISKQLLQCWNCDCSRKTRLACSPNHILFYPRDTTLGVDCQEKRAHSWGSVHRLDTCNGCNVDQQVSIVKLTCKNVWEIFCDFSKQNKKVWQQNTEMSFNQDKTAIEGNECNDLKCLYDLCSPVIMFKVYIKWRFSVTNECNTADPVPAV